MPTTCPSLARIFAVHQAIAGGRNPTLRQLADQCMVDPRTIKRDLRTLREDYHAPLAYCRDSRGYRYTRHFTLDTVPFSEGEVLTLCLLRTLAGALHNTHLATRLDGLLTKLQALLPAPAQNIMHDVAGAVAYLPDPAPPESVEQCIIYNDVLRAIESSRQVRMRYFSMAHNTESTRTIDPYLLHYGQGMWYLHGWCHLRNAPRDFALPRIRQAEVLSATFSPPDRDAIRAELDSRFSLVHGPAQDVSVWFDAKEARLVRERCWHATQRLVEHPDGSCTLTMTVGGLPTVMRWVLQFGRHAKPIAPPELVRMVHDEIHAMSRQTSA